jgi:hypothetical protein
LIVEPAQRLSTEAGAGLCETPLRPATLTASAPRSQRRPSSRQRRTSRVLAVM